MSAKGGKDFLLKMEDSPAGSATYSMVGGLRSTGFTNSADGIDVTNQGSNQNSELLDTAGIKKRSIKGSGVATDSATLTRLEDLFDSQTLWRFQVIDTGSGGRTRTALFKITSFELTGDYNNEQAFSISLESSGSVTIS